MARHLLVPMDGSEPARAALEHALSLFPDDEVTVLHAVDELAAGYGGQSMDEALADEPDFFDDVRELAASRSASVDLRQVEGAAADAILEYADEHDVDQIVIGSEGRSGVSRVLLGSIAEEVTRRSAVPVTIVH